MVIFKKTQTLHLTLGLLIFLVNVSLAQDQRNELQDSSKSFSLNVLHKTHVIGEIVTHYTRLKSLDISNNIILFIVLMPREGDSDVHEVMNIDKIEEELNFSVTQVSPNDPFLCKIFSESLDKLYFTNVGGQKIIVQSVVLKLELLRTYYFAHFDVECNKLLVLEPSVIDSQEEMYMVDQNGVIWKSIY